MVTGIKLKAITNLSGKLISKVSALVFLIILSNAMNVFEMASVVLCLSLINLGAVFSLAGLPRILTRAVAEDTASIDKVHTYRVLWFVFYVCSKRFLAVTVATVIMLMSLKIDNLLPVMSLIFGSQLCLIVIRLRMGYLRGEDRQILASFPELFIKHPVTIMTFLALSGLNGESEILVTSLLSILIGSGFCVLIILGQFSYGQIAKLLRNHKTRYVNKIQLSLQEKALNQVAFFSLLQTDIWILQALGNSEIGTYRISAQIAFFLLTFDEVFGAIFSPRIARALATEQTEILNRTITNYARIICACSLVTVPCLLMLPNEVHIGSLVYATNFNIQVVIIIASGILLSQLTGNPQLVIGLSSQNHKTTKITCTVLFVNVLLGVCLGMLFGEAGVAAATCLSFILLRSWFAARLSDDISYKINIFKVDSDKK